MADKELSPIEKYMMRLTQEQRSENSRKAGIASGIARKKAKTFRESLKGLLQLDIDDPEIREFLLAHGVDPTLLNGINFAVLLKALQGDVEAARYARDSTGEKPTDALNMKLVPTIDEFRPDKMSEMSDSDLEALMNQYEEREKAEEQRAALASASDAVVLDASETALSGNENLNQ